VTSIGGWKISLTHFAHRKHESALGGHDLDEKNATPRDVYSAFAAAAFASGFLFEVLFPHSDYV
jgi:hypothetical protein